MHITKATLEYLGDKFEVEPGGGASREAYLADHKVESYLIIPPKVSKVFHLFGFCSVLVVLGCENPLELLWPHFYLSYALHQHHII